MEIKDQISIANDFSDHPTARYRKDGDFSGQAFLEDILLPKFETAVKGQYLLLVDLDNVYGYPSSFVSGSFGKLSLLKGSPLILKHLVFKSEQNPLRVEQIKEEIVNPKSE